MKKQTGTRARATLLLSTGILWATVLIIPGQVQPRLEIVVQNVHPVLIVSGEAGAIYAIESSFDLTSSAPWVQATLLQMNSVRTAWTDPSISTARQCFYRASSTFALSDTNFVFVPAGTFTMGSPVGEALRFPDEVQHVVTLTQPFWISKYLVTQRDYLAIIGQNPSWFTPAHGFSDDAFRPVEEVSWPDATNFCALLTVREKAAGRIPSTYAFRLPTEAEWEYACRAATTTAFYLGDRLSSGEANFWGRFEYDASDGQSSNLQGIYLQQTTAVGNYSPNRWGLYDMVGNVWEWCQDWYGAYPDGAVTDPHGPTTGSAHTVRGGDWGSFGRFCRSAQRSGTIPAPASNRVGFRVVLAPSD